MNTFLLILISVISFITMVCAIISVVILTKQSDSKESVLKVVKTLAIVLGIALVIGGAFGISKLNPKSNKESSSSEKVSLENAGFNELSLDSYMELIAKDEKSVILVARPTCSYCELFTPILKQASEEMGITVNYVNTDKFTQDDWTKFTGSLSYLTEEDWGTPLVLIVQNNNVVADNGGYVELDVIKSFFEENGLGK